MLAALSASAGDDELKEKVKRLEQQVQELKALLTKEAPPVAKTETATAAAPAADSTHANGNGNGKNGWLWSAYFDGYIGHNFNRPANRTNQLRNFDVSSDQFNLNYSELVLERAADPLGFRVDLGFGQAADMVQADEPAGSMFRHLQQAYVSYKAPIGKGLVADFGKFVTALGAEVIESGSNWNYSRSLLFSYAIPYYHFGLRATYPLSSTVTVGGQLVNGWNNVTDNNSGKTGVGTVTWAPHKRLSITQNAITGPERKDSSRGRRTVADTVVSVTATDKLAFFLNYDYGLDRPGGVQRAHWTGIAGGARYSVNRRLALAPRLEWYNDRDGFTTGAARHVKEATMTVEFKLHEGLVSRLEYRRDWAHQPFFDRGARPGCGREQTTILAGIIFSHSSPR